MEIRILAGADMNEEIIDIIRTVIQDGQLLKLKHLLSGMPSPDIAEIFTYLNEKERLLMLRVLPKNQASEVFSEMEPSYRDSMLGALSDEETKGLLRGLSPDERTELFEELPGMAVQRLLNLLDPVDLIEAKQLLGYPQDSVGRLMTPHYIAVRSFWKVERALEHIRKRGPKSETVNVIYVTDEKWRLIDALDLKHFIFADPRESVEDLMDYMYIDISAYEDKENAVTTIQRYDLEALPVVDSDGILLGIVTVDDVMDVAEEEATEDFQRTAAVAPLVESYRDTPIHSLYTKRIGWLLFLVILNLFSSGVIAAYEETLAASMALAFFIPLLIDSGGNVGSQAATLAIRAISVGDLSISKWFQTMKKELGVGLFIGLSMGIAALFVGILRGGLTVGIIVSISMLFIVILTNLVGVMLPFIFTRFNIDPATASSPLITTVSDTAGLLIYFSIAQFLLGIFGT